VLAISAGTRQRHQDVGFDGFVGRRRGQCDGGVVHRRHLRPQPRRHHLIELAQRAKCGLTDAGDCATCRQPEAHRHRDGLIGIEQQWRQGRACAQLIPAAVALARVHRIAEVTQPVHVAADAAGRHAEPLGQLLAGPHAPRLQQAEKLQDPAGRFRHDFDSVVVIGPKLSYMRSRVVI
jgi:hypothetical protein